MMCNYTLKRSDRRTVSLEITRELAVLVRAPMRMPKRDIDSFVEKHAGWIETHLEKQRLRAPTGPPEQPDKAETEALKRKAAEYLPGRLAHYGVIMGLRPAGVRITSAKKRYGSCSGKNRLCFSCFLMLRPPEAIDLVVVHELAHILHKNHGKDFYACIAAVLPDWKERRKILRGDL